MSITVETEVELYDYVDVEDVVDDSGYSIDNWDFTCTPDGMVKVKIDGYVVTEEEYELLRTCNLLNVNE